MDLNLRYQKLHQEALDQVQRHGFDFDIDLENKEDSRRGLTLLLRPNQAIKENFKEFIEAVASAAPGHYFYPLSDIHVTIMPIISCIPGFRLDGLDINPYRSVITEAIYGVGKVGLRFEGVFASPSCLIIKGYMTNENLKTLRQNLRFAFSRVNLRQSLDSRYVLETAHSTVVRFKHPIKDPDCVLKVLQDFEHYFFGEQQVGQVELVFNDWYQREALVQTLARFDLGK